jgi:hypothetical protein
MVRQLPNYLAKEVFVPTARYEAGRGELASCGFFLGRLLKMRDWMGAP